MKRIIIYTNQYKDPHLEVTGKIRSYLEVAGCEVFTVTQPESYCTEEGCALVSKLDGSDCVLALGGDGTVLQAVHEMQGREIPLLGVNLGTLGYMTEVEPVNLPHALDRLLKGDYKTEHRMMLSGKVITHPDAEDEWALNDIVITRSGPMQIINYRVYVNGLFLHEYNGDGVIITTPTGSTGYNLSAGGPLVEPCAELIMLTPICPHTLNHRSIILSSADTIEIEVTPSRVGRSQSVEVNFDGNRRIPLSPGDRIRIVKSARNTEFIRINQESFLETLHKKMME